MCRVADGEPISKQMHCPELTTLCPDSTFKSSSARVCRVLTFASLAVQDRAANFVGLRGPKANA